MALSIAVLTGLIEDEMVAQGFELTGPYAFGSKMAAAIATAVVNHIQSDSELIATTSDSVGGILTGKVG